MRTFTFLALSYLSTAVWAGGYQGCLERVLMFQAYEIDGLNAPKDQTLGFKCPGPSFNIATNECKVDWVRCEPKGKPGERCSYDDFILFLGKAPMDKGWRVPVTGTIDAEATAKKCYEVYNKRNANIKNFPPYSVAKNQGEFNSLIIRVNDIVNKAYREKRTADNENLWKSFDTTIDMTLIARKGDHGPYLIGNATESKKLTGVEIKKENLGQNPVAKPPADWETLDWTATEDEARRKGITDIEERLKAFREEFYVPGSEALRHDRVIQSYKRVKESRKTCR